MDYQNLVTSNRCAKMSFRLTTTQDGEGTNFGYKMEAGAKTKDLGYAKVNDNKVFGAVI